MRARCVYLPLSLVFLVAGCVPRWREFTSREGRFAVKFPGAPTQVTRTLNTPRGPVPLHEFKQRHEAESEEYGILYNDLPVRPGQPINPDNVLDGAVAGVVKRPEYRLIEQRRISLEGSPGREISATRSNQLLLKSRIYVVDTRMYQVMVIGLKSKGWSKQAAAFLDSFKLLRE